MPSEIREFHLATPATACNKLPAFKQLVAAIVNQDLKMVKLTLKIELSYRQFIMILLMLFS